MAIRDIFSKRQKRLRGEFPDVYQYDDLPHAFRVQVVFILRELFGQHDRRAYVQTSQQRWFEHIHDILAKEYGVFALESKRSTHFQEAVFNFFLNADVEQALDVIEFSLSLADTIGSSRLKQEAGLTAVTTVEKAVTELNQRFHEHGIGYQYESGRLVRIDSEYLHHEAVKPALRLLRARHFSGAEMEFLAAHKKYRHQQYEDSIGECLKALESTLKIICMKKRWPFNNKDTANRLIGIVLDHGLVPEYLEGQFNSLRAILESGVPTIRNRESGHGRGANPRHVPVHLAIYVLHMTASTIVFLAEAATD